MVFKQAGNAAPRQAGCKPVAALDQSTKEGDDGAALPQSSTPSCRACVLVDESVGKCPRPGGRRRQPAGFRHRVVALEGTMMIFQAERVRCQVSSHRRTMVLR